MIVQTRILIILLNPEAFLPGLSQIGSIIGPSTSLISHSESFTLVTGDYWLLPNYLERGVVVWLFNPMTRNSELLIREAINPLLETLEITPVVYNFPAAKRKTLYALPRRALVGVLREIGIDLNEEIEQLSIFDLAS